MPNFFPTRRQWQKLHPESNKIIARTNDVGFEIFNPTIDKIEKGMMVRAWAANNGRETWGTIVMDINTINKTVLIADSVCAPREFAKWVDISDVKQCWDIGGMHTALKLIQSFEGTVTKLFNDRKIITAYH